MISIQMEATRGGSYETGYYHILVSQVITFHVPDFCLKSRKILYSSPSIFPPREFCCCSPSSITLTYHPPFFQPLKLYSLCLPLPSYLSPPTPAVGVLDLVTPTSYPFDPIPSSLLLLTSCTL